MAQLPLISQVEQAQAELNRLRERYSDLPPERQAQVAAEIDTFASRIGSLLNTDDNHPAGGMPDLDITNALLGEDSRRLAAVLRGAKAGVFSIDLVNQTETWSPELRDLFGVGPDAPASGEIVIAMMHPEDRARAVEFIGQAHQKGGPFYHEFRIIRPDGEVVWLNAIGTVEHDGQGRPTTVTGINQDITARKTSEAALRESEARLRASERQAHDRLAEIEAIYQNTPIGLCVFDDQLRWTRINTRMAEMNGYPAEAHIGKTPGELLGDLGREAETALRRVLETGEPANFELNGETPAQPGKMRYWNERWMPVKDEQGKVASIIVTAEEVTERKQYETALKEAHERAEWLARMPSENPDPVIRVSLEGKVLYGNRAAASLPGHRFGVGQALPGEMRDLVEVAKAQGQMLERVVDLYGRHYSIAVVPFNEAGYANLYAKDVTAREQAEAALRESQARLQESEFHARRRLGEIEAIYQNAPVGLCVFDTGLRYLRINSRLADINGFSPEAHIGKTVREIVPDISEQAEAALRGVLATGEMLEIEITGETPAQPGVIRSWNERWTPVKDEQGSIIGISVVAEETTDRKRMEAELRESEARFRGAFNHAAIGFAMTTPDGVFVDCNPAYCALTGYTLDELREFAFPQLVHPDDRAENLELARRMKAGEINDYVIENRYVRKDGQVVWVRKSISPVRAPDGTPQWNIALVEDITARKEAENALRESEQRFRAIFDRAEIGIALSGMDGLLIDCNPSFAELLGLEKGEVVGRRHISFTHPDDLLMEKARIEDGRAANRRAYDYEKRIIRKDGRVIDVHLLSSVISGAGGEPSMVIALAEDITQRKQAQEALAKAHAELENERNRLLAVMESLPVGVAIYNEKGGVTLSNPGYEAVWGSPRPRTESVGDYDNYKAWWVETGQQVQPDEWASARVVQRGETVTGQFLKIRKFDGSEGYVVNSGAPVRDAEGNIIGGAVAIMEITAQIETEQALKESQERFRVALASVPLMVYTCDRQQRYTWVEKPLAGFKAEDVLGKRDDELMPPESVAALMAAKQRALDTGQGSVQVVNVPVDGEPYYYILTIDPIKDMRGDVTGLTCAVMDITAQRRLELEQEETKLRVEVQRRLMEFRERERQEIARDLHDGPIQLVTATMYNLYSAKEAAQDAVLRVDLEEGARNLKEAIGELRDTMNALRPPAVLRFGFARCAQMHAEDFRDKHPELEVLLDLADDRHLFSESVRLALFRIFQESLTNIVKHADATQVRVHSYLSGGSFYLQIRDNGQGFDIPRDLLLLTEANHFGLVGMKERAEAIGGTFHIVSVPGTGTQIKVVVPAVMPAVMPAAEA